MTRVRKSREIKLGKIGNYTVKVGTMNAKDPRSIYVNIHGSIPKEDVPNVSCRLNEMKAKIRGGVNRIVSSNKNLSDNYLYDFSINEGGLNDGKSKMLMIEFFIRQNTPVPRPLDDVKDDIEDGVRDIAETIVSYQSPG